MQMRPISHSYKNNMQILQKANELTKWSRLYWGMLSNILHDMISLGVLNELYPFFWPILLEIFNFVYPTFINILFYISLFSPHIFERIFQENLVSVVQTSDYHIG